jgi:hypothetical protein
MNTLECNLRVSQILRDSIAFGTLEQCLETSMLCHRLESEQGVTLSQTEERLWTRLTEKILKLQEGANDAIY